MTYNNNILLFTTIKTGYKTNPYSNLETGLVNDCYNKRHHLFDVFLYRPNGLCSLYQHWRRTSEGRSSSQIRYREDIGDG